MKASYTVAKSYNDNSYICYFKIDGERNYEVKGTNGHVYVYDNLVFYGFTTKLTAQEVAEKLKRTLYKTTVDVVGGTIILAFN